MDKLANSDPKTMKIILRKAPNSLFTVLKDVFKLLAKNQLEVNEAEKVKLQKHRRIITSTSKLPIKAIKGKLIRQRGGFLPAILSTVLPLLGTFVKTFL